MERTMNRLDADPTDRTDLRALADFLDSKFRLPGGWRFGWDGIIGLIPGLGDLVTTSLSFYILARAAALGCPPSVLLRMGGNIAVDALLDAVPIIGNFFDFVFKSNLRNLRLVDDYLANPRRTTVASRFAVGATLVFIAAVLGAAVYVAYLVLRAIYLWLVSGF